MRGKYDFARRLRGQPGPRSAPDGSGFHYLHVSAPGAPHTLLTPGAPHTLLSRPSVHQIYNKTGQIASLIGSSWLGSDSRCPRWVKSGITHLEQMRSALASTTDVELDISIGPLSAKRRHAALEAFGSHARGQRTLTVHQLDARASHLPGNPRLGIAVIAAPFAALPRTAGGRR
jgi:hypothetical protein